MNRWFGTVIAPPGAKISPMERHHLGQCHYRELVFRGGDGTEQKICRGDEMLGRVGRPLHPPKTGTLIDIWTPIPAYTTRAFLRSDQGRVLPVQVTDLRDHPLEPQKYQISVRLVEPASILGTPLCRKWVKRVAEQDYFCHGNPDLHGRLTFGRIGNVASRLCTSSLREKIRSAVGGVTYEFLDLRHIDCSRRGVYCDLEFLGTLPGLLEAVATNRVFTTRGSNVLPACIDHGREATLGSSNLVALLVYAEERIDEQTDYPAWGLCYLPSEQVKTAVASVERGEFRFRMSMKEYGSREEIDYSFWTEKELLAAMTEKFFLAVPV